MRVEYLEYFIAVVDSGSISKAAGELFISPQGLRKAIQKLEEELGATLFYRNGSRLTLTNAGEEILASARKIVESSDNLEHALSPYRKGTRTTSDKLHIAAGPAISATMLPSVLVSFSRRNPDLGLWIEEMRVVEMIDRIEELKDAVIILSCPESEMERLMKNASYEMEFHMLMKLSVKASMSRKSRLAKRRTIEVEEFYSNPLVIYGKAGENLTPRPNEETFHPNVLVYSRDIRLCRTLLAVNQDCLSVSTDLEDIYLKNSSILSVPLTPALQIPMGYMINREIAEDAAVKELIGLLEQEIREKCGGEHLNEP